MGRVNVYLPDRLERAVRDALPDLSWSEFVQRALAAAVEGCGHDELTCATCQRAVVRELVERRAAVELFDVLWRVVEDLDQVELVRPDQLAWRLRKAARAAGVGGLRSYHLPRPSRSQRAARERAQAARWELERPEAA